MADARRRARRLRTIRWRAVPTRGVSPYPRGLADRQRDRGTYWLLVGAVSRALFS
jgi:hypothetical protein